MPVSEDDVIQAFLDRRNELLGTKYKRVAKPDEANRTSKDVDALCESEGAPPLAVEHTRLETFQQQIRDDAWFMRSIAPLESALAHRYDPWWVDITFFYGRGEAWGGPKELVRRVRDWLDANLASIPVQKTGREWFEGEIPEVGMVRISKHEGSQRPGVYVGRTVPTNVEFPKEGIEIMTRALGHKYDELAVYRADGYVSALLIDSRDIALTNHVEQYKAFLRSCRVDNRGGLEEVLSLIHI